jgi:hypothetical protein
MSLTQENARERYHVAKLALFNVRLLSTMQHSHSEEVRRIIESEIKRNGFGSSPSLNHQGTFISFAYICLVWLWESTKVAKLENELLEEFEKTVGCFDVSLPSAEKICGPRPLKDWCAVLRLVRNALSHGKVEIKDGHFVFSDQNVHGKNREDGPTSLALTWAELGGLSETCIHALTPVLWPSS